MHKLKNQQGATLMMALLLLLAASMVSAVILTAATSSARRLENDRAARQAYLTVSSAARLLRDDILNASFVQETVKTTYTNDTSTETSRETTSPTGFTAAWLKAGKAAVENAINGINGRMIGFERGIRDGKYACKTKLIPLTQAANTERKVPRAWINAAGNGVCQSFIDYALPLIQGEPARPLENGLPKFARLKKVLTTSID